MGRFLDAKGKATNDETLAAKDPTGQPVQNQARNLWVTETALSTALNTSFFAERVGVFTLAIGGALLLTGIGFRSSLCLAGRFAPSPEKTPAASEVKPIVQPASASIVIAGTATKGPASVGPSVNRASGAELAVTISPRDGRANGRIGSRLQCG